MNNVTIMADGFAMPDWSEKARLFAKKVLAQLKRGNWNFTILFCDDKKITELNSKYRNKNEPTDILSFKLDDPMPENKMFLSFHDVKKNKKTVYYPGDIVISLDTLRGNSLYFNVGEDEELRRLLIHGILHLDGMDHETMDKNEPMLALQEKILNKLRNVRIKSGIRDGGKSENPF